MRPLLKFTRFADRISEWLGQLSAYIVLITVLVGFVNVVLRYVGERSGQTITTNAVIEAQWYLYTLIFFFGFAYITKNGINVRVDFWYADQSEKTRAWIDVIGHIVALIPFCLLALYVTFPSVLTSWGQLPDGSFDLSKWEVSPDPNGLPRAPIKSMVLVAFVSLLLQGVAELIKKIAILRGEGDIFKETIVETDAPVRIE
jgi:TRAP-type mannitol/chloroaromatic compound transport system permease small subunit